MLYCINKTTVHIHIFLPYCVFCRCILHMATALGGNWAHSTRSAVTCCLPVPVFLTRVILTVSVPAVPLAADVPAQCRAYGAQCRVYGTQCRTYGTQCRAGNTDCGGNVNEYSFRNCSVAECFPEKLRWPWNEQVCQGVKCKAL